MLVGSAISSHLDTIIFRKKNTVIGTISCKVDTEHDIVFDAKFGGTETTVCLYMVDKFCRINEKNISLCSIGFSETCVEYDGYKLRYTPGLVSIRDADNRKRASVSKQGDSIIINCDLLITSTTPAVDREVKIVICALSMLFYKLWQYGGYVYSNALHELFDGTSSVLTFQDVVDNISKFTIASDEGNSYTVHADVVEQFAGKALTLSTSVNGVSIATALSVYGSDCHLLCSTGEKGYRSVGCLNSTVAECDCYTYKRHASDDSVCVYLNGTDCIHVVPQGDSLNISANIPSVYKDNYGIHVQTEESSITHVLYAVLFFYYGELSKDVKIHNTFVPLWYADRLAWCKKHADAELKMLSDTRLLDYMRDACACVMSNISCVECASRLDSIASSLYNVYGCAVARACVEWDTDMHTTYEHFLEYIKNESEETISNADMQYLINTSSENISHTNCVGVLCYLAGRALCIDTWSSEKAVCEFIYSIAKILLYRFNVLTLILPNVCTKDNGGSTLEEIGRILLCVDEEDYENG